MALWHALLRSDADALWLQVVGMACVDRTMALKLKERHRPLPVLRFACLDVLPFSQQQKPAIFSKAEGVGDSHCDANAKLLLQFLETRPEHWALVLP